MIKHWKQISAAALAGAVLGMALLAGCAGKTEPDRTTAASSTETTAAPAQEVVYMPGTYEAVREGKGGEVKVEVTVDEYRITELVITGEKETPDVGGAAIPKLREAILEKQSKDVDIIAGATMTSTAVKEGVAEALEKAKVKKSGSGGYTPGTYTAEAMGMHAMSITTTFDENSIVAIKVDHEETDGIGAPIVDPLVAQILEI